MKSTEDYQELIVTCVSWQSAQAVADHMLKKRLVSTVEFMEVQPRSETAASKEIKLIMRSLDADFQAVESELTKLQGHTDFVLQPATPAKAKTGRV